MPDIDFVVVEVTEVMIFFFFFRFHARNSCNKEILRGETLSNCVVKPSN